MGQNSKCNKGRKICSKKYSYVNISWSGLPTVYCPCPHKHFKSPPIDRKSLDKEQYMNLLATPRGYTWDNPNQKDCKQPTMCKLSCNKKKPSVDCTGDKGPQCKSQQMDDIWKCMTPEMCEKLMGIFVNDFNMPKNEAKQFIDEQKVNYKNNKMAMCKCPCANGDTDQNIWMKEFTDLIGCKLKDQLAVVLCGWRTKRQKILMELIVNAMSEVLCENINISCPETRMHRVLVYAADRLACWLDKMFEDASKKAAGEESDKPSDDDQKKKEEEEKQKREADEKAKKEQEEADEKAKKEQEESDEKSRKMQEAADERAKKEQEAEDEKAKKEEEAEDEKAKKEQEVEDEKAKKEEQEATDEKAKKEQEKSDAEKEAAKQAKEEAEKARQEEEEKVRHEEEEKARAQEEKRAKEEEEERARQKAEGDKARAEEEERARAEKEEADRQAAEAEAAAAAAEEPPVWVVLPPAEKPPAEEIPPPVVEEGIEEPTFVQPVEEELHVVAEDEPTPFEGEISFEAAEEEEEVPEAETKEEGKKKGKGDFDPMSVIVDWIEETEYSKTDRQKEIGKIVKGRLTEGLAEYEGQEGLGQAIDQLGNKVSTWIDKLAAEAEKEIKPLISLARRFQAPKGILYHIKRSEDNYYNVKQVSCDDLAEHKLKIHRAMTSDDIKDFTKWAEGLINVSDAWTKWVENAFCEAYTLYTRNANQPSELTAKEFQAWREKKRNEAIDWKRAQKSIYNKAQRWEEWARYTKNDIEDNSYFCDGKVGYTD